MVYGGVGGGKRCGQWREENKFRRHPPPWLEHSQEFHLNHTTALSTPLAYLEFINIPSIYISNPICHVQCNLYSNFTLPYYPCFPTIKTLEHDSAK